MLIFFSFLVRTQQPKVVEELMEEIRRLKSLLVKHEKRIRALEARASTSSTTATTAGQNDVPPSANSSLINESTPVATTPATVGANHVTHDTNANLAKAVTTEEMAPDEV